MRLMMKIKLKVLLFLSALVLSALACQSTAMAADDAKLSAIAEMGRLNGIALQCQYLDQVQRIKQALVMNLPKERALGDWFEQKTNASFMDFMNSQASCPGLLQFDKDLAQATQELETAFKK